MLLRRSINDTEAKKVYWGFSHLFDQVSVCRSFFIPVLDSSRFRQTKKDVVWYENSNYVFCLIKDEVNQQDKDGINLYQGSAKSKNVKRWDNDDKIKRI